MADKTKAELEKELAEKIAEIEKLKEEKKADVPESQKEIDDRNKWLNERVPFKAFKDNDKYKDDLVVGVNGKTYQIQRGISVMIPRFVYQVIANSDKQDLETSQFIEQKIAEYQEKLKQLS